MFWNKNFIVPDKITITIRKLVSLSGFCLLYITSKHIVPLLCKLGLED
jgi:hypothetical protein